MLKVEGLEKRLGPRVSALQGLSFVSDQKPIVSVS